MQMTTAEASRELGARFKHKFGGLEVIVEVKDVKHSYGRKRFLVKVADQRSNFVWINAPLFFQDQRPGR